MYTWWDGWLTSILVNYLFHTFPVCQTQRALKKIKHKFRFFCVQSKKFSLKISKLTLFTILDVSSFMHAEADVDSSSQKRNFLKMFASVIFMKFWVMPLHPQVLMMLKYNILQTSWLKNKISKIFTLRKKYNFS